MYRRVSRSRAHADGEFHHVHHFFQQYLSHDYNFVDEQVQQEDLDSVCKSIEAHQNELEESLSELDKNVDSQIKKFNDSNVQKRTHIHACIHMYTPVNTSHQFVLQVMQEADQERNDMYSLATDLNAYMEKMEVSLRNVVEEFNETRGLCICAFHILYVMCHTQSHTLSSISQAVLAKETMGICLETPLRFLLCSRSFRLKPYTFTIPFPYGYDDITHILA